MNALFVLTAILLLSVALTVLTDSNPASAI